MFEMSDLAAEIITGKPLNESLLNDLAEFIQNYKSMQDILTMLQGELKDMAKANGASGSKLMGDGSAIKAMNSSKKVSNQMVRMNKDAKEFIKHFRAAMEFRR